MQLLSKRTLVLFVALAACGSLSSETVAYRPSAWSLAVTPVVSVPLLAADGSSDLSFSSAWGGALGAERVLGAGSPLAVRLGAAYSVAGLKESGGIAVDGSLSEALATVGLGLSKSLSPALSLRAFLDGGVAFGRLSTGASAPYAAAIAGGGIDFKFGDALFARMDAGALFKSGLYGGVSASLGLGWHLPQNSSSGDASRLRLLEFLSLDVANLFPIYRSYYDQNPVGSVKLVNKGTEAARNVRVGFIVKQYMDVPKECASIPSLAPGASVDVPLYGLFNDRILDVTEATKAGAEIFVEYEGARSAEAGIQSRTTTVLVYDRSALTWKDDRTAAAFVSSKDPWVLDLTGNILASVKDGRNPGLAANLQTAIAFHEGLRAYGISYVLSPNRPFAKDGDAHDAVDTLKFPRQLLAFRSGDCADLSVLYASCFEAAGIETAFVTVPGHIFMAIDLGISAAEAASRAIDRSDLIMRDGRVWLPIETTMRDSGFRDVWKKAASEWRDASARNLAALYPIREAWKTYAPVGLPADGSRPVPPAASEVVKGFGAELAKAVDAELGARIAVLGPLRAEGPSAAKGLNDRGVLYGKFGRYDEAVRDFKKAAKLGSTSALVNLGNVAMIRLDPAAALSYYREAAKQLPDNPKLLVGIAKSAAALGQSDVASRSIAEARRLDPRVADRYASLAQADSSGTRAAAADDETVDWF